MSIWGIRDRPSALRLGFNFEDGSPIYELHDLLDVFNIGNLIIIFDVADNIGIVYMKFNGQFLSVKSPIVIINGRRMSFILNKPLQIGPVPSETTISVPPPEDQLACIISNADVDIR